MFNQNLNLTVSGMIFMRPKKPLKNAIIFWKKPAFEVIVWLYSSLITFPSASTTYAVKVVSPLDSGVIVQVIPSSETAYSKLSLSAVHTTFAPSGKSTSTWRTMLSP